MSNKKLVLLLVLVQSILSGCGGGSDSGNKSEQVVPDDVAGYSQASCLYKYQEGPVALARQSRLLESTYFSKKFDINLLFPVLKASAAGVIQFAELNGVHYYKTAAKESNSCKVLSPLPQAPSDIQADFSKASKSSDILGLYEGVNTIGLPSTVGVASITVLEDANKWILVHEYMHHLFALQVIADGENNVNLKDDIAKKAAAYDAAAKAMKSANPSEVATLTKEAAIKLNDLANIFLTMLKQYTLEEMTIETILGKKLESSELTLVEPKQRINGAAYIISSGKKAADLIDTVKNEVTNFRYSNLSTLGSTEGALLTKTSAQMDQMTSEINSLTSSARSFLLAQGLEYKGFSATALKSNLKNKKHSLGCSHGEIPVEFVVVIEKLKAKQRL